MGMENFNPRQQFEDAEKQKQAVIDAAHEEAFGINKQIDEAGQKARELKGGSVESAPAEKKTEVSETTQEATTEQVAGVKEEMEMSIEKKETAKQEADLKLIELEGRYLEKSKQIGGVNKEFEEKKSGLEWGVLRSSGMNILTLGAAFGVSKFLESRLNKKYQEKLAALKTERQAIDDEKLKIKDPQLYEYEMLNRKYKAEQANLKELLDYNNRNDTPYKIRL